MYSVDAQQYPAYTLNVADIHMRSGTTLPTPKPPHITKISDIPTTSKHPVAKMVDPTNVTIPTQDQLEVEPPFSRQSYTKET